MEKRFKNFKKLKIGVDFDNTIRLPNSTQNFVKKKQHQNKDK